MSSTDLLCLPACLPVRLPARPTRLSSWCGATSSSTAFQHPLCALLWCVLLRMSPYQAMWATGRGPLARQVRILFLLGCLVLWHVAPSNQSLDCQHAIDGLRSKRQQQCIEWSAAYSAQLSNTQLILACTAIAAAAALAIGFYHSLGCVSSQPLHVWDIMPGDLVANAVLAAAAATAAKTTLPLPAAAAAGSAASGSCKQPMLVVHSSSSSTYPMTLMEGWNAALEFIAVHKPNFRLSWGLPPAMTPAFQPDPAVVRRQRRWTALKVAAACALLRWDSRPLAAGIWDSQKDNYS